MLYERWQQVAQARGTDLALRDVAAGQSWSFSELARLAESSPAASAPVVYPQGHGAGFILAVLRAWRSGAISCPLEPGQTPPSVPLPPTPCIHLKTTSATTGAARLAAFTAEQLAADARNIVETMGLRPDWPNLGAISMAHSYGFSNLVLPLLLHGIPLIIAPSPFPEALRRAAEGESALTLAGVPAVWRAWHEAGAIPGSVRLGISAGAPLPVALEQAVFAAAGLKIHNFYGATECGGIAYDGGGALRAGEACAGSPMRNVELSLNDDGCLCVQGRAVGQTYWPDPAEALRAGRFQTSDLAEFKDGLVYLRGRLSEQINVAGRKVAPATIEQALRQDERVKECLVFGVPSSQGSRSETIVACVVAQARVNGENLMQFLLAKLPAWQIPRAWWFVASLETNQRGKISRAEWRRRFLAVHAGGRPASERGIHSARGRDYQWEAE